MELVFWRKSLETLFTHRCPLFSHRSGLGPVLMAVDELHTVHLGLYHDYILAVIWQAINADVYGIQGHHTFDSYAEKAILCIRRDLQAFYKTEKALKPLRPVYKIADFKLSCFGTAAFPANSGIKAAESGTLMRFCAQLASRFKAVLKGGRALEVLGESLVQYLDITRAAPLCMSASQTQGMVDALGRAIMVREAAGVLGSPSCICACTWQTTVICMVTPTAMVLG